MEPLRVGIIGTGFGATVHAPMMQWHPKYEVVSICSVSNRNPESIRETTGINRVYTDWEEMIDQETLDLVVIASMPSLHFQMAIKALSHGIHVLCEKPMALNSDQTQEMIQAADEFGRFGFVNFEWRFLPARQKVKELLTNNVIGKLTHIDYDISFPGYTSLTSGTAGWGGQQKHFGGMLGALGSHMIDSLLWWTNDNIKRVIGQLSTHIPQFVDAQGNKEIRDADDSFFVCGSLTGETTFKLQLVSAAHHATGSFVKIFGSEGSIFLKDDRIVELGKANQPLEEVLLETIPAPIELGDLPSRYFPAFKPFLDSLYHSLISSKAETDMPTFQDGHRTQIVLDAIRRSHF